MEQVTILFMEEDAAFLAAQAGQVDVGVHIGNVFGSDY